ncbi:hypothetical protein Acy02nite_68630 [Actinoplanes cyaneus]|uniref:Uncharacterized protein n=1 Tax=Actinoplanes cyaneus TaxID=52696 RepID=A0A919IPH6_9ACTN|nr:hypothetical protein [Actinoplanes cyaneus]MCW2139088.1 hypothetical protein [Actinoplanes cyaneus]GID68982.1 hypothetical protein Acy02nite_68630 [Actinoplanes cyaneus]
MSNPNKAKGTRWETALVRFLGAATLRAYRPAQEGHKDTGDLHGLSPFIGQAKDWKSWESAIREGLDGAERQKTHAREDYGVAFVKRVRRPTGAGYAVMTIATFARLLVRLRRAERILAEVAPGRYALHRLAIADELAADYDAVAKTAENTDDEPGA